MTPRRSALLWGVAGSLTFLVLVGAYWLLVGPLTVPLAALGGVAVVVGAVVAALAHRYERRLRTAGPDGRT